jgi:filamentous hemagglutinin
LRRETVNNSFLFKGAIDRDGNILSNVSGESDGSFDGLKMGGGRFGLDGVCGKQNERCAKDPNDPTRLLYNEQGLVIYTGNKGYYSFPELLADSYMAKDLIGATGGNQGSPGTMFGFSYGAGSFVDTLVESYGGSHDYIGGQFPGFYDNLGNTSRDRSVLTSIAAEVSTYVALPLATPNALSEMVSPELLQFIFATTK